MIMDTQGLDYSEVKSTYYGKIILCDFFFCPQQAKEQLNTALPKPPAIVIGNPISCNCKGVAASVLHSGLCMLSSLL